jgi:DNA-binding transcriptional ArsR family regulator
LLEAASADRGIVDSPFGQLRGANEPAVEYRWMFVTNHAMVLLCVEENADVRVRDIAALVGITQRATQAILADLVEDGFVTRLRRGRRNHYRVNRNATLRHPLVRSVTIGDLLDILRSQRSAGVTRTRLAF